MTNKHPKFFNNPARTTSLGMLRYGIEFYAAAVATDNAIGETPGHEIIAPTSVNYLIGHAIELGLKSFLLERGSSLEEIKRISHRLGIAYEQARVLGLDDHFLPSAGELEALQVLDALYSDKHFEYIETGFKQYPVFGPIQEFAKGLLLAVAHAIPSGTGFLRDNHPPGVFLKQ